MTESREKRIKIQQESMESEILPEKRAKGLLAHCGLFLFRNYAINQQSSLRKMKKYQYRVSHWISIGGCKNDESRKLKYNFKSQKYYRNLFFVVGPHNYKKSINSIKIQKQIKRIELILAPEAQSNDLNSFSHAFKSAKLKVLKLCCVAADLLGPNTPNIRYKDKGHALFHCFNYSSHQGDLKVPGKILKRQRELAALEFYSKIIIDKIQFRNFFTGIKYLNRLVHLGLFIQYSSKIPHTEINYLRKYIENKREIKRLILDFFGTDEKLVLQSKINLIDSVKELEKLRVQFAFNTYFEDDHGKSVLEKISSYHNLKALSLGLCNCSISRMFEELEADLIELNNLEILELDFSGSSLTNQAINNITNLVRTKITLKDLRLDFSSSRITDSGLSNLADALGGLLNLKRLNIILFSCGLITNNGLRDLLNGIQNSSLATTLTEFGMNLTQSSKITAQGIIAFCKFIESLQSLEEFEFEYKVLDSVDIFLEAFGRSVQNCQNLKKLKLNFKSSRISQNVIDSFYKNCKAMEQVTLLNKNNKEEIPVTSFFGIF